MPKTTLTDRARIYFGRGNTETARITTVKLGHDRVAFVSPRRIWVYEEFPTRGMVINLSPKMRGDLLVALDAVALEDQR
jgi:hypothetical protein